MEEKTILAIMDKFNASSIVEFELTENASGLKLRKAGPVSPAEAEGRAGGQAEDAGVRLGLPVNTTEEGEFITSPIVATFYSAAGPDAKPFVSSGATVKAGETLCILEAMKMMNHLEAEFDCQILEVKVKSGDLVEYGQALFRVKRA
ncbi:MAG: acetyl-CoA carboxylase biotin carboxyl carrier protein [Spirochaetaceae bacterium]|jgi:acetyl-CoA carboxylase biotin carboxyl carrier protein|nr:acetyl-CoA carboxylase biotin carboxyl carrier protein [Spirochaetaceae bacterium]